jgi:DNA-binding beta-propeller fold protein YncE
MEDQMWRCVLSPGRMSRGIVVGILLAAALCGTRVLGDRLTGGTGTIYLGSYARRIAVIDEATEKLTAEIPLETGIPWALRLSRDATRFYVQSADQEHFEVIDVASRRTLDTFRLGEADRHLRALAFDVDPQHRFMVLVARTATKLIDRFEIGPATFIQYDLKEHKIVRTVAWSTDPEPQYYFLTLRFSPDGKLLYVFSNQILIYDTTNFQKIDSWDLSLPNEPGLGRFDVGWMNETNDEPGYVTTLFTLADAVQKRRLLGVGRVNLGQKIVDFFPIGPAPEREQVSFALAADRKHGYILLQETGHYEMWTIDIPGRRLQSKVEFNGRPRMAVRSSSNGKIIYIYEAGNTIDLYEAAGFKYLRTITLDADMMYDSFHVLPPRQPRPAPTPRR